MRERIEQILEEIGIEYRYHHFEEAEAIPPPFICWITSGTANTAADGKTYVQAQNIDIELYCDERDFELEAKIECVLDKHEIFWNKEDVYIESEKMYETIYGVEV